MLIVHWYDEVFEYPYAVKRNSSIDFYDANRQLVQQITDISINEWDHIFVQNGTWTPAEEIPEDSDYMHADIDFLLMENDRLRADVDYLLMLQEAPAA